MANNMDSYRKELSDYIDKQDELYRTKFEKIASLPETHAYPYKFEPSSSTSNIHTHHSDLENDQYSGTVEKIAGRIIGKRTAGKKLLFIDLLDNGEKIQLKVSKNNVSPENFQRLKQADNGDIFGVEGEVCRTKSGELSLSLSQADILAKTLRPHSTSYQGVENIEARTRQRNLDLIWNPESRKVFETRSQLYTSVRNLLTRKKFLEVETPILQPLYGGANARPFTTHHNSLDQEMYLRIANELYLKRLVAGGMDRVFEFAKDFRNEGIDSTHNPEFTQLEMYQAYADYNDMMDLVEEIYKTAATELHDTDTITYQGTEIGIGKPWRKVSMYDAVSEQLGYDFNSAEKSRGKLPEGLNNPESQQMSNGELLVYLFEELVEDKLVQPTIVYDYPAENSPLAKKHRSIDGYTERFEFFIAGKEFGNAYSELNNPLDQRLRFQQQLANREKGDDEAHQLDEDYLRTMEYGMPPLGGMGIGMDRMTMLYTDQKSIRDVLLFPMLKNKNPVD